jgi:hypothetical protein
VRIDAAQVHLLGPDPSNKCIHATVIEAKLPTFDTPWWQIGLPIDAIPTDIGPYRIKRHDCVLWECFDRAEALRQVRRFRSFERTFRTFRPIVLESAA